MNTLIPRSNSIDAGLSGYASSVSEAEVSNLGPEVLSSPPPLTPFEPVNADWDQYAIGYFFDNFVLPQHDDRPGQLDFLPELYNNHFDVVYFRNALISVSLASLGNVSSLADHLILRARKAYGNALQQLQEALNDAEEAKSDTVLASLILTSQFQIIMGEGENSQRPHSQGQMELLRMRGSDQFSTRVGISMFRMLSAEIHMREIDGNSTPTGGLPMDTSLFQGNSPPAVFAHLLPEVNHLCSLANALLRESSSLSVVQTSIFDVIKSLVTAHGKLQDWQQSTTGEWKYTRVPFPSEELDEGTGPIYPQYLLLFEDFQTGGIWTGYWCAHIHLLRTVYSCLALVPGKSTTQVAITEGEIRSSLLKIVDDVCGAAPYFLGEINDKAVIHLGSEAKAVGAMYTTRALYFAGSSPFISSAQKEWVLERLLVIGYAKGIRQALLFRDKILNSQT
ncbi:hypothetical protein M501DRAFT_941481 [Patellaria atrata CBS 101060]|uniref:Transcription factor domain-containing protein n=1 Tax=Patellaria atrata CBS 101060 TaxID=1346257 RepID=A0A9P4S3R7_9PEZI|nr:hypothetical protein M501DRAFT_941481 [Patellaria atrata CBS 101060]